MIFNRTQQDVEKALQIRDEKVKKFVPLDESEIATLEKGILTINTLNRIEEKQQELKDLFIQDAYFVGDIYNKTWVYTDLFKQEDFDRILENIETLKKAYFVYKDTPEIPENNYRKYQRNIKKE